MVLTNKPNLPPKPKTAVEADADVATNGVEATNGTGAKRKRDVDEAGLEDPQPKKQVGKQATMQADEEPLLLDDTGNGAIVIDD